MTQDRNGFIWKTGVLGLISCVFVPVICFRPAFLAKNRRADGNPFARRFWYAARPAGALPQAAAPDAACL